MPLTGLAWRVSPYGPRGWLYMFMATAVAAVVVLGRGAARLFHIMAGRPLRRDSGYPQETYPKPSN
jgi:hypothetical protein